MEKFSTFNKDKKHTEVIAQLDCCETCESATFSENKKTKQQQQLFVFEEMHIFNKWALKNRFLCRSHYNYLFCLTNVILFRWRGGKTTPPIHFKKEKDLQEQVFVVIDF